MTHRSKRRQIEKRSTMPSHKAIREFWAPRLWEVKGFDSMTEFLSGDPCFACGFDNQGVATERAHITALCHGGSNRPENLHCLCSICHKDSERLSGEDYWKWLRERTFMDRLLSKAARGGLNLWGTFCNGSGTSKSK
jgi:hypothetical protein